MSEVVKYAVDSDGIATLTIDYPGKSMNVIDPVHPAAVSAMQQQQGLALARFHEMHATAWCQHFAMREILRTCHNYLASRNLSKSANFSW